MGVIFKSPSQIDAMKEAGRLSAKVLRKLGELIEPGISTLELDHMAEAIIRMEGGIPAFKGYNGFPGTICASINDTIVHGIPKADMILMDGDIISIDTGAIVDGWVGDNAYTYACGDVDPAVWKMCEVTEKAMWAGIEAALDHNRLGDIGHAIQSVAEGAGYKCVREYVGHGIGRHMHEDPMVPNYGKPHRGLLLQAGMVLAIEPMVNMKSHKTRALKDGWTVKTQDGLPSAHYEKTIAITYDGPIILTQE